MAIVVAPYNPWKQNIAAQIGMMIGQNALEKHRAAETGRKVAAFLGEVMQGVDPTYENAAVQNANVAREREEAQKTALGQATPPMVPTTTGERTIGGAPSPAASPYNVEAMDPRSANLLPASIRPGASLSRAPVTPTIDVVKALQLAATPRFAPYSNAIFQKVNELVNMNSVMRENAYKDFDTNLKAYVGAHQAKYGADATNGLIPERDARNMTAAIGAMIGNPLEYAANQERSEAADRGSLLDYEGKKYAADQSFKGSLANAARPVYGGNSGYQPYDGTKRDAMNFFTTTERDTFNQLIKAYGPAPTPEQVATSRQAARDEANRQTAKMYPDSPFAVEYNRSENEKREVAEFTAMAMGNQDFFKALSDAARQGEAAVRRVASQALLPNGRKPTAAQVESLVPIIMGQVKPSGQGDAQWKEYINFHQ